MVPVAAKLLGRPVKWVEDRREHFLTTTQERTRSGMFPWRLTRAAVSWA